MKDIYQVLADLKITYERHDHPAVFTVEEAEKYDQHFAAGQSKNLFLRNKTKSQFYLVVVNAYKKVDLKNLAKHLGESSLSFASAEYLHDYLNLTPGSVSPFGLINDEDKKVHVVIDTDLLANDKVAFHPNINTATLIISSHDFKKFLEWCGNEVNLINLS